MDLFGHLTCHQCKTRGKIPFIYARDGLSVAPYGIEFGIPTLENATVKNGQIIDCIEPSANHFRIPLDKYDSIFPQNCALGIHYTNVQIDYRSFVG